MQQSLAAYPFAEFGYVPAQISAITDTPDRDGTFLAKVVLPQKLKTNVDHPIHFRNGMQASAEIITEDTRLLEKILYAFRRLLAR